MESTGELVENGGFEAVTDAAPGGWTANDTALVSLVTAGGQVHSGAAAVAMENGAVLSQEVAIAGGRYYRLSFFGQGEGTSVALTATVTFLEGTTESNGLTISVPLLPEGSGSFGYYRGITIQAPEGATGARVAFLVTAAAGESAVLDDVSLTEN